MSMQIGLAGVNAATNDLNTTANNIANVSTFGFKYSRTEFGDMIAGRCGAAGVGAGVYTQDVNQLFSQGGITATDNGWDFAINGCGFFQVRDVDSNGTSVSPPFYTRNGSFHLDKDGYIVNNLGQRLQGVGGSPTAAADLKLGGTGPWSNITMDKTGKISATDSTGATVTTTPEQIGLADFSNLNGLQPVGDTNWLATAESGNLNGEANALLPPGTANLGKVMNGALESSNVNLTGQLVNMIIAQRNFGANAKTITANSEMAQTIIAIR